MQNEEDNGDHNRGARGALRLRGFREAVGQRIQGQAVPDNEPQDGARHACRLRDNRAGVRGLPRRGRGAEMEGFHAEQERALPLRHADAAGGNRPRRLHHGRAARADDADAARAQGLQPRARPRGRGADVHRHEMRRRQDTPPRGIRDEVPLRGQAGVAQQPLGDGARSGALRGI